MNQRQRSEYMCMYVVINLKGQYSSAQNIKEIRMADYPGEESWKT